MENDWADFLENWNQCTLCHWCLVRNRTFQFASTENGKIDDIREVGGDDAITHDPLRMRDDVSRDDDNVLDDIIDLGEVIFFCIQVDT
jgi:hypothetical protein